jgi:hypothetical protein
MTAQLIRETTETSDDAAEVKRIFGPRGADVDMEFASKLFA